MRIGGEVFAEQIEHAVGLLVSSSGLAEQRDGQTDTHTVS